MEAIKTKLNGVTNAIIANDPDALQLLTHLSSFTGYSTEIIKDYFNQSEESLKTLLDLIKKQPKQNWAFLIMESNSNTFYWENDDDTFAQLILTDCKIKSQNGYLFHILICFD